MPESTTPTVPLRHRSDIQGLRAVAVVLVVLDHAHIPGFAGGYIGVDVFFVISGFLITGLLMRALERDGRIGFADFYARRFRRILPASMVVLIATLVGAYLLAPPLTFGATVRDAVWTALYAPNLLFARDGTDYLANPDPSLFQHYWSLGVEEQFYFVWPLLLVVLWRLLGRRVAAVTAVLSVIVLASFAAGVVLTTVSQPLAFFLPVTRMWELGLGGLLAIAVAHGRVPRRPAVAAVSGWAGAALLVGTVATLDHDTLFPSWVALLPVLATALMIWSGSGVAQGALGAEGWAHPSYVLGTRPFTFIGEISYSIYLVHWPLLLLPAVRLQPGESLSLTGTALLGLASIPVAWLLYSLVEQPLRHLRPLVPRPRFTVVVGLVATGVTVAAALGAGWAGSARSLDSGRTAAVQEIPDSAVEAEETWTGPEGTPYVPSNLRPPLSEAEDDLPELYDNGCQLDLPDTEPRSCIYGDPATADLRVAVFGDSHAGQWFPALQRMVEERNWSVQVETKSACPAVDMPVRNASGRYRECSQWRDAVLEKLSAPDADIDVVMISQFRNHQRLSNGWDRGLERTVSTLAQNAVVVDVADTPQWPYDPVACLSTHLDDADRCALPPADVAVAADLLERQERVTTDAGGVYVDMNPYLCNARLCPMIVGDMLVYRDTHHISATYAASLRAILADRIEEAVAVMGRPGPR